MSNGFVTFLSPLYLPQKVQIKANSKIYLFNSLPKSKLTTFNRAVTTALCPYNRNISCTKREKMLSIQSMLFQLFHPLHKHLESLSLFKHKRTLTFCNLLNFTVNKNSTYTSCIQIYIYIYPLSLELNIIVRMKLHLFKISINEVH
jgi:hypothetical protein